MSENYLWLWSLTFLIDNKMKQPGRIPYTMVLFTEHLNFFYPTWNFNTEKIRFTRKCDQRQITDLQQLAMHINSACVCGEGGIYGYI